VEATCPSGTLSWMRLQCRSWERTCEEGQPLENCVAGGGGGARESFR
jgi:hypothetical protein